LIAAWGSKSLDLGCGITKDRYVSKGYNLKYVVNSSVNIKPQNIIDVTGFGMEKIKSLYEEGYTYFVISREGLTGVHFRAGSLIKPFDSKRSSRRRQTISLRMPLDCLHSHFLQTS